MMHLHPTHSPISYSKPGCFVLFCFWKIFNLPASSGAQIGKMPRPGLEQPYRGFGAPATTATEMGKNNSAAAEYF